MFCEKARAAKGQQLVPAPSVKEILKHEMITVVIADHSGVIHIGLESVDLAVMDISGVSPT